MFLKKNKNISFKFKIFIIFFIYISVYYSYIIYFRFKENIKTDEVIEDISVIPKNNCRIQILVAGNYSNYNPKYIPMWIGKSNNTCIFEIIRESHWFINNRLNIDEIFVLNKMLKVPVIAADFMKFLSLYYLGGLYIDFDIEPLKLFPDEWIYNNIKITDKCDILFGVEHNCYEEYCLKQNSYPRIGQILTWIGYSKKPYSLFLKKFLNYTVNEFYKNNLNLLKVQDVAGSGIISDFLRKYIGKEYLDIENSYGTLKKVI